MVIIDSVAEGHDSSGGTGALADCRLETQRSVNEEASKQQETLLRLRRANYAASSSCCSSVRPFASVGRSACAPAVSVSVCMLVKEGSSIIQRRLRSEGPMETRGAPFLLLRLVGRHASVFSCYCSSQFCNKQTARMTPSSRRPGAGNKLERGRKEQKEGSLKRTTKMRLRN